MKWTLRHWIQRHKTHIPTLWRCNLIVMGKMQFASITRGLRCTLHQKERILTSCSHYSTMARMSTNRTSLPDSVECGVEGRKARSRKVIDPARCRYKSSGRVWMESVAHGITIWTSRPGKKARSVKAQRSRDITWSVYILANLIITFPQFVTSPLIDTEDYYSRIEKVMGPAARS